LSIETEHRKKLHILKMDLVLGHHRDATCLMALNYDDVVSQGITLHRKGGDRVTMIVVLFNHGEKLESVKKSLDDIPRNRYGWWIGSPGEILDRIQSIVCPGSVVNTRQRALDHSVPLLVAAQECSEPKSVSKSRQKKPEITS
jgi:hypothetical protein